MERPAALVPGCSLNASLVAVPALTLNAGLVALVRFAAAAVSVYPVPAFSSERPGNEATPLAAVAVVVPMSVAPAVFVPRASVIDGVADVTRLLAASSTST
jgi:hypothetical protein